MFNPFEFVWSIAWVLLRVGAALFVLSALIIVLATVVTRLVQRAWFGPDSG